MEAKRSDRYRSRKAYAANNQVNHTQRSEENDMTTPNASLTENTTNKRSSVSKLRLELIINKQDRKLMNVLRKYANVKEGIVREILVPSDI